MIYKLKGDKPDVTLTGISELPQGLEFPIVITQNSVSYLEVWEAEEFDTEDLSVRIEDFNRVLFEGELLEEG